MPRLARWLRAARRGAEVCGSGPGASETDVRMMRRALELAEDAGARGEVPVGAVVYDTSTGRVLAEAANDRETTKDASGHAEHRAIVDACSVVGDWRLNDATLVVTLEPCAMCAGLIVNARVGRVVIGASDPKAGAVCSLYRLLEDPRLNHRVQPVTGVLAGESSRLLRSFFRSRRRSKR